MKNIIQHKNKVKFLTDVVIWSGLTVLAFLLRLEGDIIRYGNELLLSLLVLAPVKLIAIFYFKLYRQSWQNVSVSDFISIFKANIFVYAFFFLFALGMRGNVATIPISVPFIESGLMFLFLGGARVAIRIYFKNFYVWKDNPRQNRILIAGAGESGTMAAREMLRKPEAGMKPVAFLDDDLRKRKERFLGVPVMGTIRDMAAVVKEMSIDEVIIAMPSESGSVIRRVLKYVKAADVQHRIIPSIHDLISGRVEINQIRQVDVEDLLRRKPIQLETGLIKEYLLGKRVLVTGAGGSIGSELVRQISRFDPAEVILLGRGENSIHQLVREIDEFIPNLNYSIRIGDVRDLVTMEKLFRETQPEVVFHAAAHKHVPLMEKNPEQAIFNNVGGTRNMVNLSVEYGVSHFVNISTDKAVNPTSVMGTSKRISEHIVEWGASQAKNDEVFVSVRFGNVLGSRGSVIPIFKDQIRRGGPVRVTHPDMIRYFMTIPEASQLVLQAGALNHNGAVFVLDMGDPVNIEQMARDLITLSGLEPDKDIKIEYSGIRPGEKLFEELLTAEEGTDMTQHEKIFMCRKNGAFQDLTHHLNELFETAETGTGHEIRMAMKGMVPTYSYNEPAKVLSDDLIKD